MIMETRYKDKKFNNKAEFESWLKENTHVTVQLKDIGQDLLTLHACPEGEVLHTNIQSTIYNGRIIDLSHAEPDKNLRVWDEDVKAFVIYPFVIESCTTKEKVTTP